MLITHLIVVLKNTYYYTHGIYRYRYLLQIRRFYLFLFYVELFQLDGRSVTSSPYLSIHSSVDLLLTSDICLIMAGTNKIVEVTRALDSL